MAMTKRQLQSGKNFLSINPDALDYLARTRHAEVVCYLDYDGVLQSDRVYRHPKGGIYVGQTDSMGSSLFEHVGELVRALEPYPDIRIVLSTDWVRKLSFTRAKSYLPDALSVRVIGATYHSFAHGRDSALKFVHNDSSRATQILADVQRRKPKFWFAIDDDTVDWPKHLAKNLVECEGSTGLGSPKALEALGRILDNIRESRRVRVDVPSFRR